MAITNPSLTVADIQTLMTQREGTLSNLMDASQYEATGTITAITKADPGVMTISDHEFQDGDVLALASIGGMTELNGESVTATVIDDDHISIGVDTTEMTDYTTGGTATRARTGWTKKITAAWNMVQFDLRSKRGLTLANISIYDSDDEENDVQDDLNMCTAMLALAFIFGDASENVGTDSADRYAQKSERYYAEYNGMIERLVIDYDSDEDGTIDDSEVDKINPTVWGL